MTCEEFEQILLHSHDRVSGDGWMLRASRVALVQEHVNNCPACAATMAETTRLEDALNQLRVSTMHIEAPAIVEKELLDTFRENAGKRHVAIGLAFPWKLVWASTATLVLVVSTALLYSRFRSDSVLKEQANGSGRPEVISPPYPPDVRNSAPSIKRSHNPEIDNPGEKGRSAQAHAGMTEVSKAPSVLQTSDMLSLNGGGSVVRVTLPVSSLVAMGVPVRPELSESRVTADVWMDPFGAVVGVRLVPENASAD